MLARYRVAEAVIAAIRPIHRRPTLVKFHLVSDGLAIGMRSRGTTESFSVVTGPILGGGSDEVRRQCLVENGNIFQGTLKSSVVSWSIANAKITLLIHRTYVLPRRIIASGHFIAIKKQHMSATIKSHRYVVPTAVRYIVHISFNFVDISAPIAHQCSAVQSQGNSSLRKVRCAPSQ